jgi:sporulation protein YlmC with PRC-barrel domain
MNTDKHGTRQPMDVVHDVLDKPIVDRNGQEMGRVDGIVLDVREDAPPRLAELLIGASVLGARVNPVLGRWVHGLEHGLGIGDQRPIRIAFSHVDTIGEKVKVDLTVGETDADMLEARIRTWLLKIPGSK